jgi:hypothetical protein
MSLVWARDSPSRQRWPTPRSRPVTWSDSGPCSLSGYVDYCPGQDREPLHSSFANLHHPPRRPQIRPMPSIRHIPDSKRRSRRGCLPCRKRRRKCEWFEFSRLSSKHSLTRRLPICRRRTEAGMWQLHGQERWLCLPTTDLRLREPEG